MCTYCLKGQQPEETEALIMQTSFYSFVCFSFVKTIVHFPSSSFDLSVKDFKVKSFVE